MHVSDQPPADPPVSASLSHRATTRSPAFLPRAELTWLHAKTNLRSTVAGLNTPARWRDQHDLINPTIQLNMTHCIINITGHVPDTSLECRSITEAKQHFMTVSRESYQLGIRITGYIHLAGSADQKKNEPVYILSTGERGGLIIKPHE